MVWPIMGDVCRQSIHLKDGVRASQRVRRPGRSAAYAACLDLVQHLNLIYSVLTGTSSHATAPPARDRPAQMSISIRNPKTNAWAIDSRIATIAPVSTPEGKSRPASLI